MKLTKILDILIFLLAAMVFVTLMVTHKALWPLIAVYWLTVSVRNFTKI